MKPLLTPSILFLALAGCAATATVPSPRFANAAVPSVVDDRRDVPKPPAHRFFLRDSYFFDGSFEEPLTHPLELPRARRALGVNALDEVPDSTWFTNRIGAHVLTADQIRAGNVTDDPERHKPWTVRSSKIGGTSVGFIIVDASGVKYMIKFDGADDQPELETGTHVAVNRLLWTCGYNVPQDQIVYIRPSDLVLAPDAQVKDLFGRNKRRLERAEFERDFALVKHDSDGRIRAMASRWIDGPTLGGHPGAGVRADDPNDRIPHELRRDLRGQYAFYAWLDAVDVTEGQYVDSWIADPANPKRHYVEHYAIDFGKSLGVMASSAFSWSRGYTYEIDFPQMARNLLTLGFAPQPWRERAAPPLRGVSPVFEARSFDPGTWHPDLAAYTPFLTADRFDKFWAAKIIGRFSRAQIHAAVEAGRFSDPRAADYITDTLVARQRATMAYWFARVNPLDGFVRAPGASDGSICFDDLAILHGLTPAEDTHYEVTSYDYRGAPLGGAVRVEAQAGGHICTPPVLLAKRDDHGGYTILRVTTRRRGFAGSTFVHLAPDPAGGGTRVIGVWRA